MKKCSKCSEWKDESEFGSHNTAKDGLTNKCIECSNNKPRDNIKLQKKRNKKIKEIRNSFFNEGYILITDEYENNTQKLEFVCPNGHYSSISGKRGLKGARCKFCTGYTPIIQGRKQCSICKNWKSIKKHKNIINTYNLERGRDRDKYHIDHIFSVLDGFKNNVPIYIISHYSNLRVTKGRENLRKDCKSDININKLYKKWEEAT